MKRRMRCFACVAKAYNNRQLLPRIRQFPTAARYFFLRLRCISHRYRLLAAAAIQRVFQTFNLVPEPVQIASCRNVGAVVRTFVANKVGTLQAVEQVAVSRREVVFAFFIDPSFQGG